MKDYSERQIEDGSIVRKYDDGTILVYKKWDSHNIYIKLLHSLNPGHGVARMHLEHFLQNRTNKDIYTYVSDELGADLRKLEKFYSSIGFVQMKMTHIRGERVNFKLTAHE